MKVIANFNEAHAALAAFYPNAQTKYELTVMRKLMDYLGNPQEKLRVVHVAGTSGKTSTAYYVSALLEQSGAKVGLTVSPHVDEVNERLQVNHRPLSESEFCRELSSFLQLIESSGLKPSYFEVMVAFAYWYFAKAKVDYAVVEVGLGGLLDGTNVVSRPDKVCIITDIGLDHTEVLGSTVEEIAAQKAGIVQPGNQVFMYEQNPAIVAIVEVACRAQGSTLELVPETAAIPQASLPLFQQRNLGLAKQVVDYVLQRDDKPQLSDQQISQAAKVSIPARMETFKLGDKTVIVDGSHNAQKLTALAESIRALYPAQKIAALVAFVDGDSGRWQAGAEVLMKLADNIIVTSFWAEQDAPKQPVPPAKLQKFCKSHGYENVKIMPKPADALTELLKSPEPLLLVAGSFYLLNSVRPLIMKMHD
ncbi:MAG TPA: Mur ligase family protein [Patescibacteria group bacterium]|nr:Mur ligase family protein [Patescibacteria group bacterium]